jgi:hypothetical protein
VHKHPIAYDQASDVADGYAMVAKLYDRDTSSEEAHTAALIAIEGRLNLSLILSVLLPTTWAPSRTAPGATNPRH